MKKRFFLLAYLFSVSLLAAPEIISRRPENPRIVRALDQELAELFTFPRGVSTRKLRITFDRDAPKKIVRLQTPRTVELVIRDDADWFWDEEVMSRLAGALFANRAGCEKELRIPRFLLAAMRGELRGVANAQRVNRSNRWLIFLRALLAAERPIDFGCAARDDAFAPVAIYQEEAAQVLLYAARRRELANGILRDILAGDPATEKLLLSLDEAARKEGFPDADKLLLETAKQRVWHAFAPRPAKVSRREFTRLAQREIEELDPFGKPTGRRVPVDLEIWCEMVGSRPDAEIMRKAFQRDLHDFARGETPESRAVINRLAALECRPGDGEKVIAAKLELENVWREREKVENFLAESEARFGGIGAHAPSRIDAVRHRPELLSPRGKAFLDRVEKLYLGE